MTNAPAGYATEIANSVAYPGTMTSDNLEKHRKALRALAAEAERARTLPERRTKAVASARAAGMTWREASVILGMSTEGLRRADERARAEAPTETSSPDETN